MSITSYIDLASCIRLVVTLGHFLWQATAIAALAWLAGALMSDATSRLRYGVLVLALVAMAACPVVTYVCVDTPMVASLPAGPATTGAPPPLSMSAEADDPAPLPAVAPSPADDTTFPASVETSRGAWADEGGAASAQDTPPAQRPVEASHDGWRVLAPWLTALYFAGVLGMVVRLLFALHGGRRLGLASEPAEDAGLLATAAGRAKALGLRLTPAIAYCRRIAVPTVVGILRPMILLPASLATGLTTEQTEAILTHELAHIRRYDHLVNLLQRVIESALFFHPAVWYVSRRIRAERENCCDDLAVALGGRRYVYASSLVRLGEISLRQESGPGLAGPATLAAADRPSQLRRRVVRLFEGTGHERVRLLRDWPMALILPALVIMAALLFVSANAKPPRPIGRTDPPPAAPTRDELLAKRDTILAKAGADIRAGLVELAKAGKFPQLGKADDLRRKLGRGRTVAGQLHIFVARPRPNSKRISPGEPPVAKTDRFSVLVTLQPVVHRERPAQAVEFPIYRALGLAGQVNAQAGDPALDKALKLLLAWALAPLKKLDRQVAAAPAAVKPIMPTVATLGKWLAGKEVVQVRFLGPHMKPLKLLGSLKVKVADNNRTFRLMAGEMATGYSYVKVCMRVSPENTRKLLSIQKQLRGTRHRLTPANTHVWSLAGDPNARAKAREMAPKVLAAAANGIRTALPNAQTKPERPRGEWRLAGITCKAPGVSKTVYIRIHEITAMMRWNFDPSFAEQTIHLPRLGLVVTTYHIPNDVLLPARAAIRKAVNEAVAPLLKLEGNTVRRHARPLPRPDQPKPTPAALPSSSAAKALDARIAKLIAQLGSDEHKQREAAQKELIQIGKPAIGALKAAADGKDAERKTRAKAALQQIKEQTALKKEAWRNRWEGMSLSFSLSTASGRDGSMSIDIDPRGKAVARLWDTRRKALVSYESVLTRKDLDATAKRLGMQRPWEWQDLPKLQAAGSGTIVITIAVENRSARLEQPWPLPRNAALTRRQTEQIMVAVMSVRAAMTHLVEVVRRDATIRAQTGGAGGVDGKDPIVIRPAPERTVVQKVIDLLDLPWQTQLTAKQLDQAAASILPDADKAVEAVMKKYDTSSNAFRHRAVEVLERMGTDKARLALLDIALGWTRDRLPSSQAWAAQAYLETIDDKADARNLLACDNPQVLSLALRALKGRPVDEALLKRLGQIVRAKPPMTSRWHFCRFAAAGVLSADKRNALLTERVDLLLGMLSDVAKMPAEDKRIVEHSTVTYGESAYSRLLGHLVAMPAPAGALLKIVSTQRRGAEHDILVIALALRGDTSVRKDIRTILTEGKRHVYRVPAAGALGVIGGTDDLPLLKRLAETDPFQRDSGSDVGPPGTQKIFPVRRAAKDAIQTIESKAATPPAAPDKAKPAPPPTPPTPGDRVDRGKDQADGLQVRLELLGQAERRSPIRPEARLYVRNTGNRTINLPRSNVTGRKMKSVFWNVGLSIEVRMPDGKICSYSFVDDSDPTYWSTVRSGPKRTMYTKPIKAGRQLGLGISLGDLTDSQGAKLTALKGVHSLRPVLTVTGAAGNWWLGSSTGPWIAVKIGKQPGTTGKTPVFFTPAVKTPAPATQPAKAFKASFESLTVEITSTWAWNRTITIKGDGSYTFDLQQLKKAPGLNRMEVDPNRYVATHRIEPAHLRRLEKLLGATKWLAGGGKIWPRLEDGTKYTMTVVRDGKATTTTCYGDQEQAYADLVRFLRRVNRQEWLLYQFGKDAGYRSDPERAIASELDALVPKPSTIKPYAPVLDFHRFVPPLAAMLAAPAGRKSDELIAAARLMGYLRIESQRKVLEALAATLAIKEPRVRAEAIRALGRLGGPKSIRALLALTDDGDRQIQDSLADAFVQLQGSEAIGVLTQLARKNRHAAWTLISLGPPAVPAIVDVLNRKHDRSDRSDYYLIRAYFDHWKDIPKPVDPRVIDAIYDRVELGRCDSYTLKVLKLAGRPFVVLTPRQTFEAFLTTLASNNAKAIARAMTIHFRNNDPGKFLPRAKAGKLKITCMHAERNTAWFTMVDRDDKRSCYLVWMNLDSGRVWSVSAAMPRTPERLEAMLQKILDEHPDAKKVQLPLPAAKGAKNAVTGQDKAAATDGPKALKEFLDRMQRFRRGTSWPKRKLITRNDAGRITGLFLKDAKLEKNDFVVIGALGHLETLELTSTNVTSDDLKHLAGHKNLRVLKLDWNSGVGDAGVAHLGRLTSLETLDLRLTKVTGKGLGALVGLKNLRHLDVNDSPVDDVGLKHISQLARLELLNIGGTKITDKGLHHLKGLKHLRGLTLEETPITNEGLNYLAKFPRFTWISSPVSTAQEFVRRLEKGDFKAASYMYSPSIYMPSRGKMTNTRLDPLPPNAKDKKFNQVRFRAEMHWTVPAERIDTTLFGTFAVDHGAIRMHRAGIEE